jgi:hypothetical protein
MADAPQNSVTRDDLRDALAHSGPRRRPTGLLSPRPDEARREPAPAPEPAWDWDAAPSAADQLELEELRGVTAEQRHHIDELVTAQAAAAEAERELREALAELAGAGVLRRRAVVAGLRRRGLI